MGKDGDERMNVLPVLKRRMQTRSGEGGILDFLSIKSSHPEAKGLVYVET